MTKLDSRTIMLVFFGWCLGQALATDGLVWVILRLVVALVFLVLLFRALRREYLLPSVARETEHA